MRYRAIIADGDIQCDDYERTENGIDCFRGDGEFVAFVPYGSLVALLDEETLTHEDRSIV
ncbi:hypothetical protein ACFPYI_06680 [Halomarina salina]|uniref:Uncharacterized protein n=1 Tax=Halomarina salina TaxID=1872699 RepID=A0ABD5RKG3_9EURY|nr:hypothetical protein [Halomarina salina]